MSLSKMEDGWSMYKNHMHFYILARNNYKINNYHLLYHLKHLGTCNNMCETSKNYDFWNKLNKI